MPGLDSGMHVFLYSIAALLILVGLAGAVIPMLPGIPIIFGGIWLAAGVDHYQHVSSGWLIGIGIIAAVGLLLDFAAAALGAKRVGASGAGGCGRALGHCHRLVLRNTGAGVRTLCRRADR